MSAKVTALPYSRILTLLYGVMCFLLLVEPIATRAQTTPAGSNSNIPPNSSGQEVAPSRRIRPLHIVPFGPPSQRQPRSRTAASEPILPYWGGPVISQIHVVEVFWGSFVYAASTAGLEQYFTDVTNSAYFDLLSEYGTVNVTGQGGAPGSNQLISRGLFDGKYVITPSVCPGSAATPPPSCSLTDDQIQNELVNQLSNLPAPITDAQGNYNTIYLIYFPPGVSISVQNSHSCVGGGFCAYHSSLTQLTEPHIPYGVFPDFSPVSGCSQGCGESTAFDNLTSASSHEIAEAVTDVDVSNATAFAPPLAWDSDQTGEEIGDICNQQQAQITVGAKTYTVQKLWSNMQNRCVTASAGYALNTVNNAVPGEGFSLTVGVEVPGAAGGAPLYDHTVHFTSTDAQAVLPPDYKFVPATDAGVHTFSATLNSLSAQTITATDVSDQVITASATVSVSHNPDLTVALSHSGNFTQGQSGVSYTLSVGNGGDRPTAGAVTVVATLSPQLSATAISGTGWTCTLGTATCTRADALAAASHFAAITITANVSPTAPLTIFSNANTSGGGEVNSFNDAASDSTTIVQLGDLTIASTHAGSFSQGQTGASYSLAVTNVGLTSTSGKVTVVDSLPAGLTATSITGTGWNCTLATLTCTRGDAQVANGSYPPITLTVNVAANAPASVTNSVTVSGGGEVNTANDTSTDPATVTAPASDLTVASTHTGNFAQGQAGATYNLVVTNIGPAATSGMVTVTDGFDPSFAMSATAISGTGWNCTLSTLTCTRSDVLAAGPGSSYPAITVTGTVSPVSPTSLSNDATVSGGGELDTTNDAASDPTNILPWPDMVLLKSHTGDFSPGQTGATYTLTAINNGGGAPFGTLSVTDALPSGLTATDMSGTGWSCTLSTLTCTRSDSMLFYPPITLTVNVAADAPSSVTNTATVSGGGEIYTADNSASDPTNILATVSVTLQQSNGTVTAGGSATYSFAVVTTGAGSADLSCGALPAKSACTFQPSSVSGSQTVNLTISTTANTNSSSLSFPGGRSLPLYAVLLPLMGLVWATRGRRKRVETQFGRGARVFSFAGLLLLSSCGGGSMTGLPPPPNGTPPGTYIVSVAANNGAAKAQGTATVTLIVK